MALVRHIEISNFRSIKEFQWFPTAGINCLIGPGDSGKSSIIEAIDLCLGARRNVQFSDADFHKINIDSPIVIKITIGDLGDSLKNLDSYGLYLRGYENVFDIIYDEPETDAETVLTIQLKVESDLEPVWSLFSERAAAQGQSRSLGWSERLKLAPTKIGTFASYDLSWRRGSVLSRLSEERADAAAALVKVSRDARSAYGEEANKQLTEARKIVAATAKELGISGGKNVKAMLDADSVSLGGGTISLHDEHGIPLSNLGTGSARLLVAGLQRKAAGQAAIVLIDELEHGLEPHRIIRLLGSLGAKEKESPLQVFVTTHSPVAVRELSGQQLYVVRKSDNGHQALNVGLEDDIQAAIRSFPEAFLAPSIIVCEGATEVGFIRGFDQFQTANGSESMMAHGVALVDGGGITNVYKRALAFQSLGCRTAVFRDDDVSPLKETEIEFRDAGGGIFSWAAGMAIEDAYFGNLDSAVIGQLLEKAVEFHGEETINAHIKSASDNKFNLASCRAEITPANRKVLSKASRGKKSPWFKTVSSMEEIARDIIAPDDRAATQFKSKVKEIFQWTHSGAGD